jgi:release factor glutamine methyltransferase
MLVLRQQIHLGELLLQKGPHPERAHLDAEALMRHALGKDKAWLIAHGNDEISDGDAALFRAFIASRNIGQPIQHILGETEFYGLPFLVSSDVLIPRPETEHLVEKIVEIVPRFPNPRIVDVGTGSGAIAIAVAHEWPGAVITAIDVSAPALKLARRNAERNGVAERIRFLPGDLLAPVADERFDMVVSNPPYVPMGDRDSLSIEVREHEPALALFAGADGLDVYRRLIPAAFAVLEPDGFLLMEIGYGQSAPVAALLKEACFERIDFAPDLHGIPRVACGRRTA